MIVKLLEDMEEDSYCDFVNSNPDSTIYHTLEWKSIIEETYRYVPFYVIAKEEERIVGILPLFQVKSVFFGNRIVSLPFSHFVNVLFETDEILNQMLAFAKELVVRKKANFLEVKHGFVLPESSGLIESKHMFNSVLDLSKSLDELWSDLDTKSTRWGVKRAQKSNLEILTSETIGDYRHFYELELETRKKQGSPPYSFSFFENIFQYLNKSQRKLLLVSFEGRIIAGIIILYHKRQAVYGYSASVNDKELLRKQPTNLLLWTAISQANRDGYQSFDFGTTPTHNKGLLRFKSGWGTEDIRIPYYYFLNGVEKIPVIDRTTRKIKILNGILKRTPIPILKVIGPYILRQVG